MHGWIDSIETTMGGAVAGTRRRANDPERRRRILDAALATIAAHGVHATTHRKIAAAADVPLGSVTYYFDGLEQILEESFTALADAMSTRYRDALDGASDPDEACAAVTDLICGPEHAGPDVMTLIHEMYSFARHNAATAALTKTWLLRSHATLARHFSPRASRAIDALMEALPMHRDFEGVPLDRTMVHTAVRAIAAAFPLERGPATAGGVPAPGMGSGRALSAEESGWRLDRAVVAPDRPVIWMDR